MGLDMYAYRCRKATEAEVKNLIETGRTGNGVFFIKKKDFEEDYEMYKDLESLFTEVSYIDQSDLDMKKIMEAYNIPENATIGMIGYKKDSIDLAFNWKYKNGRYGRREISIPRSQLDKYGMTEPYDGYMWIGEEVGYWRKAYDLQDEIYDAYDGGIVNCGFHWCNEDMIRAMLDYDERGDDEEKWGHTDGSFDEGSEDIYYHEWY